MEKFFKFFITVQFVNIVLFSASYAGQTVKVGIYQNFPICFTDEHGEVQGIYIDVLAHVAKNEGWKIEYTAKTWNECLEGLKLRKIDLLCGIAYTEKRAENYFFNKENIIVDWGQIYLPKGSDIQSVIDLHGKKVVTVEKGILLQALKKLMNQFDIECRFIRVKDPHDVFKKIEQGSADAGTALRLFGLKSERRYNVKPSPIIFAPLQLRFAAGYADNFNLLRVIDRYLSELKKNENSALYLSVDRWLLSEHRRSHLPVWALWSIAVTAGLAAFLFVISFILKHQVAHKTAELTDRNNELKNEILVRTETEKALQESEHRIKASLREKEVLLREIYHRTKNNMEVISSILALQSEKLEDYQVKKIFKDTENRIRSMALVHQKLYQSKNLSNINLKDYINDLAELLLKSYNAEKISCISEADNIFVLIDIAIPCGLILNELITNSLKYAFPADSQGEIKIVLNRTDNNEIFIRFSDNGIGFPKNFDFKNSDTLGIRMVISIVEHQLGGAVDFETNNGMVCQVKFKDDLYSERVLKS